MPPGARNPFLAAKERPLVVGHRGVPSRHQENTLVGFRRAVALGVPAIELDARLTADRKVVVFHDPDLRRMTGDPRDVVDVTWAELARLRLARDVSMGVDAYGTPVRATYPTEEAIPLLEEILAEVGGDAAINIELKIDLRGWWNAELGGIVAELIAAARLQDRVIVTSFDPRRLRSAHRTHPELAIGFCFDDSMLGFAGAILDEHGARRTLTRVLEADVVGRVLGTRLVGAEHTLVGAHTVRHLHARGIAVGTHTIFPVGSTTGKRIAPSAMTEAEAHRLIALGVDWIETDDPERLMALMAG